MKPVKRMRPLGDATRRALLCVSAMLCAIPVVLMPLAGRSSFEAAAERERFVRRFDVALPGPLHPRAYTAPVLLRDPFALPSHAIARSGVPTGIAAHETSVRVSAVVQGADTRALVEENGTVRVVRTGDVLGGSVVLEVGSAGVRLANGTFIAIGRDRR